MADLLIRGASEYDTIIVTLGKAYDAVSGEDYELVVLPKHGRLIDADRLHESMYHRAFETDGDTMWQSGCWVRYRAIEQVQESAPTVIEASEVEE